MKKLLINIDDDLAKVLEKSPNKSQAVREALKVYNEDISTDTVDGLRRSYKVLQNYMAGKFEYYDKCFERLDRLINMLETRM